MDDGAKDAKCDAVRTVLARLEDRGVCTDSFPEIGALIDPAVALGDWFADEIERQGRTILEMHDEKVAREQTEMSQP